MSWCAQPDGRSGVIAGMPCNINWEKRNVYVVEGLPVAYSQYAYSKRIMYVDKDFWAQNFLGNVRTTVGELWKTLV